MPNTGTSVSAKKRSAFRIVPSPPRTRHASGCPSSSSSAPTPSAAAPCLERSASAATSSHPASRCQLHRQTDGIARLLRLGVREERDGLDRGGSWSATVQGSTSSAARSIPSASRPEPPRAAHMNVSRFPFGPGQIRRGEPPDGKPHLGSRCRHSHERLAPIARVPDDPRLHAGAAELELRLHHRQDVAIWRNALRHGGNHLRERDERDVDRREPWLERKIGRHDRAGVGPLDHVNALVVRALTTRAARVRRRARSRAPRRAGAGSP